MAGCKYDAYRAVLLARLCLQLPQSIQCPDVGLWQRWWAVQRPGLREGVINASQPACSLAR
jgi:hypothetical protein